MPPRSICLLVALAPVAAEARSIAAPSAPVAYRQYAGEIAAAQAVLDAYLDAFNRRDLKAWEATFNFPHVRFASNKVTILQPGQQTADMFTAGPLADWDHSEWARRDVINASPDKVHIHTHFNRYRKDGSLIGGFDSIYIVTKLDGHWGVQGRSSFAP